VLTLGSGGFPSGREEENTFLAWFELKENFPFFINIYSSCGCRVERFRVLVFN
jgi:hypothetical protein